MGKGYNNYMCKKPFHPGSKSNIKRAWMAEQKTENEKRKQEELKVQYEKEQDLYNNRALLGSENKEKLELNFMYEAPPGAKRERQKEDDEPEYKFEWQRKYNAPREDYAKGNADIKDQPFGIPVRNVRCIKCHKWGHINTDKECPLYSQASTSSMPTTSMDPLELMRQMREDGYNLKETVLGHHLNPMASNQQFIPSDESDPEIEFLKTLSTADKKKLLRKLKKLSKKQEKAAKSKKKKAKKSKRNAKEESSDSESENTDSRSESSLNESKKEHKKKNQKEINPKSSKYLNEHKISYSNESESKNKFIKSHHSTFEKMDKEHHKSSKYPTDTVNKYKTNKVFTNQQPMDRTELNKSKYHDDSSDLDYDKRKKIRQLSNRKRSYSPENTNTKKYTTKNHKKKNRNRSTSPINEDIKGITSLNPEQKMKSIDSEKERIKFRMMEENKFKTPVCKVEKSSQNKQDPKVSHVLEDDILKDGTNTDHPDGFNHSCPQAIINSNYLLATKEYSGALDDRFRDVHRDLRSPSVKQKYKT